MLDDLKTIFEILAYLSAAIFFVFKAYSGVFYVSLSVAITSDKRKKLNEEEDILVVDLGLTGGESALLDIYKVQGRISFDNTDPQYFDFEGIERLDIDNKNNDLEISNPWTADTAYKYRIGVNETTSFVKKLIVPQNAACRIDVVVVGSRKKFFTKKPTISQWRASHISLPN
ncbi:MAG: hypothetical protein QM802_07215 [Agriterribacter sp.]